MSCEIIVFICIVVACHATAAFFAYVAGFSNGRIAGRIDGKIALLKQDEEHLRELSIIFATKNLGELQEVVDEIIRKREVAAQCNN
jgi:tagatose-1,6-bisphosphate aldolase